MKKWVLAALISIGLILTAAATGCAKKAIAKVNGQVVTEDEFYQQLQKGRYGSMILDRLIVTAMVKQEAQKKGIAVSDQEVNASLAAMKKPFAGGWQNWLDSQGLTETDLKDDIRFRILLAKLFVGEAEMKKFFAENRSMFDRPAQVRYRRIVVASEAEAKKIYTELTGGKADFAKLARERSLDTFSKERGGEMPMVYENTTDKELNEVLFRLKPNEISPPLKAIYPKDAFQVVQVLEHKPAVKAEYDQVKDEVMQATISRQTGDIFRKLAELKAAAQLEIYPPQFQSLAREYQQLKERTPPQMGQPTPAQPGGSGPAAPPSGPAATESQPPAGK